MTYAILMSVILLLSFGFALCFIKGASHGTRIESDKAQEEFLKQLSLKKHNL